MTSPPLLQAEGIDKSFPGVHALDHVDFDLHEGEAHVVLGENGAGKSTLMKIFSGSLPKDSGRILLDGEEIEIRNPQHARDLGIGMVYQDLSLIPTLSAAENIFLGRLPKRKPVNIVDWTQVFSTAAGILDDLGADIDPKTPVRDLGMAQRQLTEIAKVLSMNVRILLLDEPTSALSDEEREHLFFCRWGFAPVPDHPRFRGRHDLPILRLVQSASAGQDDALPRTGLRPKECSGGGLVLPQSVQGRQSPVDVLVGLSRVPGTRVPRTRSRLHGCDRPDAHGRGHEPRGHRHDVRWRRRGCRYLPAGHRTSVAGSPS